LQSRPLEAENCVIAPGGFFASGGGMTAGDLLSCGGQKIPGFFVAEHDSVWVYAMPGSEVAFPLSYAPTAVRLDGAPLEFHCSSGVVMVRLPDRAKKTGTVWHLEPVK